MLLEMFYLDVAGSYRCVIRLKAAPALVVRWLWSRRLSTEQGILLHVQNVFTVSWQGVHNMSIVSIVHRAIITHTFIFVLLIWGHTWCVCACVPEDMEWKLALIDFRYICIPSANLRLHRCEWLIWTLGCSFQWQVNWVFQTWPWCMGNNIIFPYICFAFPLS